MTIRTETRALEHVKTPDGLKIALYRYASTRQDRRHPVLLVHGLGSNHSIFDALPLGENEGQGLAEHLSQSGFVVYSIDLRGRGGSDGPHTGDTRDWSVDHYVVYDLPAALAHIVKSTGAKRIHWLGHSMGGLLSFLYQICHGPDSIQSAVAMGAGLYDITRRSTFRFAWMFPYFSPRKLRVLPAERALRFVAPFSSGSLPLLQMLYVSSNMMPTTARHLWRHGVGDVSLGEVEQLLGLVAPQGMTSVDGAIPYSFSGHCVRSPTLVVVGDQDPLVPLPSVAWTVATLGSRKKQMLTFGRPFGHRTSYGHADLLCGIHAPREVWPQIVSWLVQHDEKWVS